MSIDPNQFAIDQVRQVLQAMGWRITKTDLEGVDVVVTIARPKDQGAV